MRRSTSSIPQSQGFEFPYHLPFAWLKCFTTPMALICTISAMSPSLLQIPLFASVSIIPAEPNTDLFGDACARCFRSPMQPCLTLISTFGPRSGSRCGVSDIGSARRATQCDAVPEIVSSSICERLLLIERTHASLLDFPMIALHR